MRVYLDHQSTNPLIKEVRDAMMPYLGNQFGHPASLHVEGFQAREAVKMARGQIAALIHAEEPESILFTGSPTEALNLGVKGAALALQRSGKHLVMSTAEQPGVAQPAAALESLGFSVTPVGVDPCGRIDCAAIQAAVRKDTVLVCLHHANLDVGTIQPIQAMGEWTSTRGVALFVDATASTGWTTVDVQAMRADLLAMAPHRFGGPRGLGILYRHRRARIQPVIHGTDLDGSENVPAIVGAGMAADIANRDLPTREARTRSLQRLFLEECRRDVPRLKLNGPEPGPERLCNNLNLSVEFVEGEGLALMLDVKGVALASGAACLARTMRVPPVLAAIGLPESLAKGNVIVSFGMEHTEDEIRFAAGALAKAAAALREMSPGWEDFKAGA